mmetsp:Transcript_11373/g.27246  ORF Transcript_11373/g.27246 Transcript_11373/m.27246 type:complete len:89 (-) Transcript_11373:392-658(-)
MRCQILSFYERNGNKLFFFPPALVFTSSSKFPEDTLSANSAHPPMQFPLTKTFGSDVAPLSTNSDRSTRLTESFPFSKNHSAPTSIFL